MARKKKKEPKKRKTPVKKVGNKSRRIERVVGKKTPKKGTRGGQSKEFGSKRYYVKGGTAHEYDTKRDRKTKAKRVRKRGEAKWRGDAKGSRV